MVVANENIRVQKHKDFWIPHMIRNKMVPSFLTLHGLTTVEIVKYHKLS